MGAWGSMIARRRRGAAPAAMAASLAAMAAVFAACGPAAPPAMAFGEEAVSEHQLYVDGSPGPVTTLALTALDVRTGTIEELKSAGYQLDDDQLDRTPLYVDVRAENRGTESGDRRVSVSLEDQDGNLITPVTVFDYGGPPFAACPDTNEGTFAPGDTYETCVLFLVPPGREAARVSWLPSVIGTETDWVYWAIP